MLMLASLSHTEVDYIDKLEQSQSCEAKLGQHIVLSCIMQH